MNELAEYLRRTQQSQGALAARAGISSGQLSRVASGRSRPSPELAKRIETATAGEVSAARLLGVAEKAAVFDHIEPASSLGDGRWGATVGSDGSLLLSGDAVAALGFAPGEHLVLRQEDGDVRINSSDKTLARIQSRLKQLVPPGVSIVDELIAERRAEAARE